jgi:hypothetical protein
MSNFQAPRPAGMGGAPRPGESRGSVTNMVRPGGMGGAKPPQPKVKAPSSTSLLLVFIGLVLITSTSVYVTPSPLTHPAVSFASVIGGLLGLFGCTIAYGYYRFMVNQQSAANTFAEWNFPLSRGRLAQVVTVVGWATGAANCYLIAYELARDFVKGVA